MKVRHKIEVQYCHYYVKLTYCVLACINGRNIFTARQGKMSAIKIAPVEIVSQ